MSLHIARGREAKPLPRLVRKSPEIDPGAPHPEAAHPRSDRPNADIPGAVNVTSLAAERAQAALRFPVGADTRAFYRGFYPDSTLAEWNDWRWQMRSQIRTLAGTQPGISPFGG